MTVKDWVDVLTVQPFESIISIVTISLFAKALPFASEKVNELSPGLTAVVVDIRPEFTLKEYCAPT